MQPRVFHPYLLGLYPVLFQLSHNIGQIGDLSPAEVLLPAAVILTATAVAARLARVTLGDRDRAGILISLFLVWFFSYGHVLSFITEAAESYFGMVRLFIRPRYTLPAYSLPMLVAGFLVIRTRRPLIVHTKFANAMSVALLVLPLGNLFSFGLHGPDDWRPADGSVTEMAGASSVSATELPDIYYIVLDGYGSGKTLRQIYGHDNSDFLEDLTDRGFHVEDNSKSNYAYTMVSLASTLNMRYLNDLLDEDATERSFEFAKLNQMIHESSVVTTLKASGYRYIHFPSGSMLTNYNRHADVSVASGAWDEFQMMLIKLTVLGPLFPTNQRGKVDYTFSMLGQARQMAPAPRFVFAHILCPHPPFVFGPNGEEVQPAGENDLQTWDDKDAYVAQLKYVNKRVKELVDTILQESSRPPVIVLQGDHGPASTDHSRRGREHYQELMTILNARHLPGVDELPETLTPVNTFRVVFNAYLGTDLPLLEDRSYYSYYKDQPFKFIDVTEILAPAPGDDAQMPRGHARRSPPGEQGMPAVGEGEKP